MPSFTTPTQQQGVRSGDPLFDRYSFPVGLTVMRSGATWVTRPYPWLGEIADLAEGSDYFLGGRTYIISNDIAAELQAAGYETGA